jgi:hypothetical protein
MRDRFLVTVPLMWVVTSSGAAAELQLAIEVVYRKIGMEFRPNCYLIDEDTAEVRALCDAHGVRHCFCRHIRCADVTPLLLIGERG